MKYTTYSISKYNPRYFDENGLYTREEWTSKYDIGKCYDNQVFDVKEYLCMEDNYINVIRYLLSEHKITALVVLELERYSAVKEENEFLINEKLEKYIEDVEEGTVLRTDQIEFVCRAMLREYIWCKLYSKKEHFIISTGYDFYIHLICEELTENQKSEIQSMGHFVYEQNDDKQE